MQSRFYDIMGCFLDDERLAAFAIVEFSDSQKEPEEIYGDLLAGKYFLWISSLEKIAEDTKWIVLKEWCLNKQAFLDCLGSHFWSCGDTAMIEKAGWKLNNEDEDE